MGKVRKMILCAILFIAANCIIPAVQAQGFDDDVDDGMSDMPLDGNITMMAAGGFAYIIKKVAERRKKD